MKKNKNQKPRGKDVQRAAGALLGSLSPPFRPSDIFSSPLQPCSSEQMMCQGSVEMRRKSCNAMQCKCRMLCAQEASCIFLTYLNLISALGLPEKGLLHITPSLTFDFSH